jgi:hypothetical protein
MGTASADREALEDALDDEEGVMLVLELELEVEVAVDDIVDDGEEVSDAEEEGVADAIDVALGLAEELEDDVGEAVLLLEDVGDSEPLAVDDAEGVILADIDTDALGDELDVDDADADIDTDALGDELDVDDADADIDTDALGDELDVDDADADIDTDALGDELDVDDADADIDTDALGDELDVDDADADIDTDALGDELDVDDADADIDTDALGDELDVDDADADIDTDALGDVDEVGVGDADAAIQSEAHVALNEPAPLVAKSELTHCPLRRGCFMHVLQSLSEQKKRSKPTLDATGKTTNEEPSIFLVQVDDFTLTKDLSGPMQSLSSEYSIVQRPHCNGGGRASTGPHSIRIEDFGPAGEHAPEMKRSERQFLLQNGSVQTMLVPLRLSSSQATIKLDSNPCRWQNGDC